MMLNRPRPIRPGDKIAVVAPASLPIELDTIEHGVSTLRARGYEVLLPDAPFERYGYLAGSDARRADDLNHFLRRDDVAAIIAVRGGYGTLRILPQIDYEAARRHPKLLVGYSDITALQLALLTKSGVPSLSGPMIAVEWGEPHGPSEQLFWDLARGAAAGDVIGPGGEMLEAMSSGEATGPLIGGNLMLISRLIGTPFMPDLDGAILFLEEVGEEPYKIDGQLAHLQLAGVLDRIGGLVIGGFTDWEPKHDRPSLTLDQVFDDYLRGRPYPIARGLRYGHFPDKNTIPIGVRARLSVGGTTASLSILEPVTA